jgi:hypothetical protein
MLLNPCLRRKFGAAGRTSDEHFTGLGLYALMLRVSLVMVHQSGLGSEFNTAGGAFYQRFHGLGLCGNGFGGGVSEQGKSRSESSKSQ